MVLADFLDIDGDSAPLVSSIPLVPQASSCTVWQTLCLLSESDTLHKFPTELKQHVPEVVVPRFLLPTTTPFAMLSKRVSLMTRLI